MQTRAIVIVVLAILGVYFLVAHYPSFPLSHESIGLPNHTIHRIIGVVLLAGTGYLWWKGKETR